MRRFLVAFLLLLSACSDSSGPKAYRPDLSTPNGVMKAVSHSFSDADVALYDQLLAPDFHFEFDALEWTPAGTLDGRWDRAVSLDAFGLLVSAPAAKADGRSQLLASSFTPVEEIWSEWPDGEFVGCLHRNYDVSLSARLEDGREYEIATTGDFTVAEVDGQFRLVHWRETIPVFARTNVSYGVLQATLFGGYLDRVIAGQLTMAFTNMDFQLYDATRDADFLFEFAPEDIAASGSPNGIWDRARDSASIQNMFSGQPGGPTTAPIVSVSFELTPQFFAWMRNTLPEPQSGWYARFALTGTFTTAQQDIFQVSGIQQLHAKRTETGYRLVYWRDEGLPVVKATSQESLGSMKAKF